jgi:hypothetical protein
MFTCELSDQIFITNFIVRPVGLSVMFELRGTLEVHVARVPLVPERGDGVGAPVINVANGPRSATSSICWLRSRARKRALHSSRKPMNYHLPTVARSCDKGRSFMGAERARDKT